MEHVSIARVALAAATYAIDKLYSYRVPDELREQVRIGTRVLVPFGFGNKRAEAVVLAFRKDDGGHPLKPVVEVLVPGQEKVTYVKMTQEKAVRVVNDHLVNGNVVAEYTVGSLMK